MEIDFKQMSAMFADEENKILLREKDKCDKYDYLTAVCCGAIGGIIDVFLVGAPNDTRLGKWTDSQVDGVVKAFARKVGWNPSEEKKDSVASAIGFLERKFKVNYDQRHTADVENLFNMSTKNHHMMSLAHSPDPIGLFFSILNQFTNTATFLANGQFITISSETAELQGGNFIAKIFCGIANWFGHLMSDVAGSSGAVTRGSGIVMPFYELLALCKFGEFNVGKDRQDLATIATRAFQEGYDFRFGLAQAIPVIITDLTIRLIWALRRHFQYEFPIKECIPTQRHETLRVMLLLGNGTLCLIDGIDAGIRSGGNALLFFERMNLIAWLRFVMLVLKEVFLRVGIMDALQMNIDAYIRVREALQSYLYELQELDIESFKEETEKYNDVVKIFETISSEEALNKLLLEKYIELDIEKPWKGDFGEHMSNKKGTLVFK